MRVSDTSVNGGKGGTAPFSRGPPGAGADGGAVAGALESEEEKAKGDAAGPGGGWKKVDRSRKQKSRQTGEVSGPKGDVFRVSKNPTNARRLATARPGVAKAGAASNLAGAASNLDGSRKLAWQAQPNPSALAGRTFETIDPRTGEVIARVAEGDKEDVDQAVKAARKAFDHGKWPRMSGYERGRIMMRFADLIEENLEELATLDSIDGGKLFNLGKSIEIPLSVQTLRYYAGAADKIHGETLKLSGEYQGITLREPIGVVGHIIPWNSPTLLLFMKVSPALAAGCTMVVKPAEQTPLSALYHVHLAKQAGIPDGVLNVVTGFGSTAGAAICSHMDVDQVSFTGSTEVGRLIMEAAAKSNLKSVSLELGGKSPLIIFDDANVDMAVNLANEAIFQNKGEICIAASRVFVQEGIYDEFVKKAAKITKSWVVGDPFDPNVQQGPQVDKEQFEKVLRYIQHGKSEGATLLTGGKACGEKGYYIEPTIFTDVKEHMLIAQDEIFGPVMSLMKFKTIEEAIEKANDTRYGLGAGIVTKDLNIANRVSRSVRAGTV